MAKYQFSATLGQTVNAAVDPGQHVVNGSPRGGKLDAAVAAAVAIGAGDASAAVTAIQTEVGVADMQLLVNTANVTTPNRFRRLIEEILRQAQSAGML